METLPALLTGILILRIAALSGALGRPRSAIYAMLDPESPSYDPTFPRPIRLSARTVGWHQAEILEWLESRPRCGAEKLEGA